MLEHANGVRKGMLAVKREVKAGDLTLADALTDPRAGSLTCRDLLASLPGWRERAACRVLERVIIPELKRVRTLTERQHGVLVSHVAVANRNGRRVQA
jgi:hypothetical protein